MKVLESARETVLEAWCRTSGVDARQATLLELDRLLGTQLQDGSWPDDLGDFLSAVGGKLEGRPLVSFLAPNKTAASLVEALAEILFVPRLQRTEYVESRQVVPPWDIRRLLLEYAVWSCRVDSLLGALTKGFCARSCERLPVGCCSVLGYDMGMVPEAMLRAQELEARAAGWSPPPTEVGHGDEARYERSERGRPAVEDACKYHGPEGCCLRLFKSPACAGMLCDELVTDLENRYPRERLEAFHIPLARFRNHQLDREEIFLLMAEVVDRGQRLTRSPK